MSKNTSSFRMGNEFNVYGEKSFLNASEHATYSPLSQENIDVPPDYSHQLLKAPGGMPVVINPLKMDSFANVLLGSVPVINKTIVKKNGSTDKYVTKFNISSNTIKNNAYPIHKSRATKSAEIVKWTDYFSITIESNLNLREEIPSGKILAKCPSGGSVQVNEAEIDLDDDNKRWAWTRYKDEKGVVTEGWASMEFMRKDKKRTINFPESVYKSIDGWVEYKKETKKIKETRNINAIENWGQPGKGRYPIAVNKKGSRYVVAVPPKIIIEDYPDDGKVLESDFRPYSKYLKVFLKIKSKYKNTGEPAEKILDCVIGDIKAHSFSKYPYKDSSKNNSDDVKAAEVTIGNGMIQTGIKYMNVDEKSNAAYVKFSTFNANVIEFCCHKVDFSYEHYNLVKIETNYEKTTRGKDYTKL